MTIKGALKESCIPKLAYQTTKDYTCNKYSVVLEKRSQGQTKIFRYKHHKTHFGYIQPVYQESYNETKMCPKGVHQFMAIYFQEKQLIKQI